MRHLMEINPISRDLALPWAVVYTDETHARRLVGGPDEAHPLTLICQFATMSLRSMD